MQIIIETFIQQGEPSTSEVRARPLRGQGLPTTLRVECSKPMRRDHPIGTLFKVWATLTNREGTEFIYSNWRDPYQVVSRAQAVAFIRHTYGTSRRDSAA